MDVTNRNRFEESSAEERIPDPPQGDTRLGTVVSNSERKQKREDPKASHQNGTRHSTHETKKQNQNQGQRQRNVIKSNRHVTNPSTDLLPRNAKVPPATGPRARPTEPAASIMPVFFVTAVESWWTFFDTSTI